jgi:hypothetical protein
MLYREEKRVMPLSNFSVEYQYDNLLQVLVPALDGNQLVLAFIDRAAIDDAWPDRALSKVCHNQLDNCTLRYPALSTG